MYTLMLVKNNRVRFLPIDKQLAQQYGLKNGSLTPFSRLKVRVW